MERRRLPSPTETVVRHSNRRRPTQPESEHFWDTDQEVKLLADFGRRNFWSFFMDVFGAGANPKGELWIDPLVHQPLADWFQLHVDEWFAAREHGRGYQKHLAILIPRGMGKTTMFTQAGQLWLHARDPELSSFVGSESNVLSQKILGAIKGTLDGSDPYSLFTKLYGNWSTEARGWTGRAITHSARKNTSRHDPSLGTFSVETSIVGAHPDVIFYDDPISYERLTTDQNWLATVNSQITSLFPVIQADGLIVWVGTRYDANDHFGVAFNGKDAEGVKSLSGMETDSIDVRDNGKWHVYFLAGRDKAGKPISDMIWNEKNLTDYERRDPYRYASQIMNDPSLSETNPITKQQLDECVIPSKEVPWGALTYVITTDTAFWDGKAIARRGQKDETVMQVWGYPRNLSGDVYFIEGYSSDRWRAEEFADRLVSTVQRYRSQGRRIRAITDEVTMAGKKGAWEMSLRNYFHDANEPMPTIISFRRGNEMKINRIVAAASFMVHGHVRVVENAPGWKALRDQLNQIGQMQIKRNMRDDWVDCYSDVFQPELYSPMRRGLNVKPPWEKGSQLLGMDDLDTDLFRNKDWDLEVARPPIK